MLKVDGNEWRVREFTTIGAWTVPMWGFALPA